MGISQKKNKKKAKTSIGSKKTFKKSSSSKKKNKKKSKKTKPTTKRYTNNFKTNPSVKQDQNLVLNDLPSKINISDTTPEKVVTIVSAFKPQLKNIAKIGFTNATALVDTNTVALAYKVPSQNLSFQYQPISLIPRAIKKDSLVSNKQIISFKIGVGNYMNQFIQAQTSLIDSKNQNHSFNIKNESIAGGHPIQRWSSLNFNYLNALNLNQNKQINSQIILNQSNRYRYGLVPDTTKLPLSNFEQKFTIVGARFSLSNRNLKNNFIELLPILELNNENLHNQAKNLTVNFTTPINFNFKNKLVLQNDFRFSFNQYNLTNKTSAQNYFVQIDPSVNLKIKQFQLNMGVRPTILNGEFA
jgi:flagellar assembly factor FliW